MTLEEWRLIIGGMLVGVGVPILQAIMALIRGKKDIELAEVEITERIQKIAEQAVKTAQDAADRAESKADRALRDLREVKLQANRAFDELDRVYAWIEEGMPRPAPSRPDWLPRQGRTDRR